MGCDIHPVVQRRIKNKWEFVEIPGASDKGERRWNNPILDGLSGRNYDLFAVLGNVRNGTGFAGVVTGERIAPLTSNRGLPEDFSQEVKAKYSSHASYHDNPEDVINLGDHSFSWCTLEELLSYNWNESRIKVGVVDQGTFEEWDGVSQPRAWCGDTFGPNIVIISEEEARNGQWVRGKENHVRITWRKSIKDSCKRFVEHVIPWLQTLGEPKNVRLVFGFDS